MNVKQFSEAMSAIDGKYVEETLRYQGKSRTSAWVKWGAAAACIAVFAGAVLLLPRLSAGLAAPVEGSMDGEIADVETVLNIYYLSESGEIESESVEVRCTAADVFNAWAALNGVSGVTVTGCLYDSGGTETVQGEATEYAPGSYFTLDLTVSAGFSAYAEGENDELLVESLRRTFFEYLSFDEFHLMIEEGG